jgi:ribosome-binding protein aMBF1 (putative translation factor)
MTQARQIVQRGAKRFVLVEESEYRRLSQAARAGAPSLPEPDANGNRPAVPFAQAVMARSLIEQRTGLGWSQAELARRAGVRVETLNRIERGHVTPDTATLAKLDVLLRHKRQGSNRSSSRAAGAKPDGTRRKRSAGTSTGSARKQR